MDTYKGTAKRTSMSLQNVLIDRHALQDKTESSQSLSSDHIKEMIQTSINTLIASALFVFGVTVKTIPTLFSEQTIPLYVDFGASNHMTSMEDSKHNLTPYNGKMDILAADGKKMPMLVL